MDELAQYYLLLGSAAWVERLAGVQGLSGFTHIPVVREWLQIMLKDPKREVRSLAAIVIKGIANTRADLVESKH